MLSVNCIICFKSGKTLKLTEKLNDNSETLKLQLHYIAPEVDWLDSYQICQDCIQHLLGAYEFKQKCLNIVHHWKIETDNDYLGDFKSEYPSDSDSNLVDNNYFEPTDGEQPQQSFICYLCSESYKQKDDLVKHFENQHQTSGNSKYKRKEICATCGRKYVSQSSLKEHILICDGIKRHCKSEAEYQCEKCGKYYTTKKILNAHKLKCDDKILKISEFQCTNCNKFYNSERTLKNHENEGCRKTGTVKDVIYCKICEEICSSPLDLEDHLSAVHNSTVIPCNKCNLSFENKSDLETHKKLKHLHKKSKPTRKFSCEICKEEFTLLKDIKNHCLEVHSMSEKAIKPYECEICNTRLRTSTNLTNHKLYHEKTRMNICSFCGKTFITKNDLASHEVIHYGTRKYKCDKCEKSFKTNTNLRTHLLIVHTDPVLWKHVCDICGKRFPQKSSFDQHRRRHLGEKKFSCQLCDKTFTSKGELQGHLKGHSNIQAYKCVYCGKAYRKRHTYNVHMTKIHGIGNTKFKIPEKKFACHICPGKFTDKIKLKRHLCTHTGVKPFSCYACDKKFIDKSYLKHHLKTLHNLDPDLVELTS